MWNKNKSVTLSIVCCFAFAAILAAAVFIGPLLIKLWFVSYRGWDADGDAIGRILSLFCACFYPSVPFGFLTLYSLLKMLFNIRREEIFITQNVKYLRRISWSCIAVSIITFVGGIFYLPFLCVAVAAAFVGLMLRTVKNVMQNATEIKEENELTI